MKTVQITNVRYIPVNAKNPLPLFILDLASGQPSIVRSEAEFLTDLRNSYLIGENVRNANHPALLSVLRDLQGATVSGTILFAKKGDSWTVTENSRVITDSTHPNFGKVAVGDKLPYEKDMTLVTDGFLTIALAPHIAMMNKQAEAYGFSLASMLNTFNGTTPQSTATTTGAEPVDVPEVADDSAIDPSIVAEAIAEEQPK